MSFWGTKKKAQGSKFRGFRNDKCIVVCVSGHTPVASAPQRRSVHRIFSADAEEHHSCRLLRVNSLTTSIHVVALLTWCAIFSLIDCRISTAKTCVWSQGCYCRHKSCHW